MTAHRVARSPGLGVLLCLACVALPLSLMASAATSPAPPPQQPVRRTSAAPAAAAASTPGGDSIELADDKDFMFEDLLEHHSVVCPKPMCECRHAGSGGIAAKCTSLDFKGQRFQGVVNHLEVSDAPELNSGLFLVNNSLASLGLQFLTTVKIANSSIKGLSLSTFDGLTDLYDVDLSDNRIMIPHRDLFQKNPQLRKLSLRGNPINVAQLVETPMEKSHLLNSASLNELDLSRCDLASLSPHTFSRMRHLERLILVGNSIETLVPETLAGLGELEELDLSSNYIKALSTLMFINNTELTELRLRNNSIRSLRGVEILGLDELDLSENWFDTLDNETFQGFPALTRLNLSDNSILKIDARAFQPLRHLQDLDLSGNEINGPLPRDVFAACEVLETLSLSDNPRMKNLPEGGFAGQFTALFQLDLSYTGLVGLGDDSFLGMDHLSILNLQSNKLTELSAGVLRRLPQLITLDLSGNDISALDAKAFQTNGFLRHLDLSRNPLMAVSPQLFAGTPYLRWLDLSYCQLTSLWDKQTAAPAAGQGGDRASALRKLAHLNVANNEIKTLRVRDVSLFTGLSMLDLSENPLECTKELHFLMEWLVKHSVAPRAERKVAGALQADLLLAVEDMMEEENSLRGRWSAIYDKMCGARSFDNERVRLQKNILASSRGPAAAAAIPTPAPARKGVTQEELDDIKFVIGTKTLPALSPDADEMDGDDDDEDEDTYDETDDATDSSVRSSTDDDEDDSDEDDEDDDEYDDSNLISDPSGNGTDFMAFTQRGSPYLWPVLTIGALLATTVLVVSNVVVCLVRRRRARRHARVLSPIYRQLGGMPAGQHNKAFGGIPGSFIKTKKDGGFVYRKLYEETTTPVFVPPTAQPQARTFRFPLDPSDLQGPNDPQRV